MLASERHRAILEHLDRSGAVRVSELARFLSVTEETIRRDLKTLDDQQRLERTHGGAVSLRPEDGRRELPLSLRRSAYRAEKHEIALAALALIQPGQTIALDASSTASQLAALLPDEPLTVVTNSLDIAMLLAGRAHLEVIGTGGTLDREALAYTGLHAERTLESIQIDQLFFSCRGLDPDRGLSEIKENHAAIKLKMLRTCRQKTLMADRSKIGVASRVYFAQLHDVDRIITNPANNDSDTQHLHSIRQRHQNVVLAGAESNQAELITKPESDASI
jgi:DeoR/GlpR family transcriptional regulator of sugar metabolism